MFGMRVGMQTETMRSEGIDHIVSIAQKQCLALATSEAKRTSYPRIGEQIRYLQGPSSARGLMGSSTSMNREINGLRLTDPV